MDEDEKAFNLPPELICEIFSRLPTESLLRFRSASKSICALIGRPDFIRLHAYRSSNKFTILHRVNYKAEGATKSVYTINSAGEGQLSYSGITPVEYPFKEKNIVGSCNGILCVYEYDRSIIHLWNPSIRRKVTLRFLPPWLPGLALGFGLDPYAHDYKILWTAKGEFSFVYSMKTHTWREIASPDMDPFSVVNSPMCFFCRSLHWVVKRDFRSSGCYMMRFNLCSEVFSTIELPEPTWETSTVVVIKGCLAVVSSSSSSSSSSKDDNDDTRIWLRTADSSSWSLAFKLDTCCQPVHSINGDLLFGHYSKGILYYHDPETGLPSRLVNLTNSYVDGMITCIESLELLDCGTSCDQGNQIKTGLGLLDTGKQIERGFTCFDRGTSRDQRKQIKRVPPLTDRRTAGKQIERGFHVTTDSSSAVKRCLRRQVAYISKRIIELNASLIASLLGLE